MDMLVTKSFNLVGGVSAVIQSHCHCVSDFAKDMDTYTSAEKEIQGLKHNVGKKNPLDIGSTCYVQAFKKLTMLESVKNVCKTLTYDCCAKMKCNLLLTLL